MHFGYARVSTKDQNEARQIEALTEHGVETNNLLIDKACGVTRDRPALSELIIKLRAGDEVAVVSMDRLARTLIDLQTLVKEITDKGAAIRFLKEKQCFSGDAHDPITAF